VGEGEGVGEGVSLSLDDGFSLGVVEAVSFGCG